MLYFVMYVNIYIIYIYHEDDCNQIISFIHPYNYLDTPHSYTKFLIPTSNPSSNYLFEYYRIFYRLILVLCCIVFIGRSTAVFIGNFLYFHLLLLLIILILIYFICWIMNIILILYVNVFFSCFHFGFVSWMGICLLLVGNIRSHQGTTHLLSSHIYVPHPRSMVLLW